MRFDRARQAQSVYDAKKAELAEALRAAKRELDDSHTSLAEELVEQDLAAEAAEQQQQQQVLAGSSSRHRHHCCAQCQRLRGKPGSWLHRLMSSWHLCRSCSQSLMRSLAEKKNLQKKNPKPKKKDQDQLNSSSCLHPGCLCTCAP